VSIVAKEQNREDGLLDEKKEIIRPKRKAYPVVPKKKRTTSSGAGQNEETKRIRRGREKSAGVISPATKPGKRKRVVASKWERERQGGDLKANRERAARPSIRREGSGSPRGEKKSERSSFIGKIVGCRVDRLGEGRKLHDPDECAELEEDPAPSTGGRGGW